MGNKQFNDEQKEQVRKLAAFGLTQAEVAGVMNVDIKTLVKYSRTEYEMGHANIVKDLKEVLYERAKAGKTTELLFALKNYAGMAENVRTEITGKDGGPIKVNARCMTEGELSTEIAKLEKALSKQKV